MSNILILGAGAAGLNAAHHLSRAGHPVTILEARDRIGGRIHTLRPPNSPIPLELGAEFVHGLPSSTWNLLHSIPATAYDIPDTHWRIQNSRITQTNFWPQIDSILQKLSSLKKHDLSFADFLKKYAQRQSPQSRQLATSFIEGFNATDSTLVSSLSLKSAQSAADQIDEMKAFRLTAGYDQLPQYLLSTLPPDSLRLSTPVRHIAWSKHSVHIHTHDDRTFHARAVIITVPLGVLQSSLTFDPPLPPEKQHALAHMKMGSVVKILVRFRHPFWEKNHSDLCFLHASPDAPFPTCWTTLPLRTTLLTGWAGGPAADRLANLPPSQILHQFLSSLSKPFNLSTAKLHSLVDAYHLADWQSDPLAGHGAYSYALVNGSRAPSALARPHHSTLFFAGEHTHPRETGTVAAALETGHRAAQQLLNSLPEP